MDNLYVFKLISGCSDIKLQEKLFKLPNPTLPIIQQEAAAHELAKKCISAVQKDSSKSPVIRVSQVRAQQKRGGRQSTSKNPPRRNCFKCGNAMHANRDDCKAIGRKCTECGKDGHFARARDGSALCFQLRKRTEGTQPPNKGD